MSKALSRAGEPALVDQRRIRDLAVKINEICRSATLDLAYRVGELVIQEIYEGSLEAWAEHGTRSISYRKLAHRGDLIMSPSALCRAVAVYTLCERFGGRESWRHLTASHLQEVLPLPVDQQERLLDIAEAEHWTVARLRAEVSKRRPPRRRGGKTGLAKVVGRLKSVLGMMDMDTLGDLEGVSSGELTEVLEDVQRRLAEIAGALHRSREQSKQSEMRLKCPGNKT
jgi:hypothetical protein